MKRYLIHILEFYLIAGTLCACGYAALLLGGYFDQAPRAVYIQQEGAEGAFADQIAAMLGDDLRLTIADSGDDLLTQATELLESDACALVLDLKTIPENAQALTELAREKQIALIWLGARPDAKVLEYENSWYVGSDPAQAGELLGEQAAMLFREGTAADRNADLLLQYVWAGNTAFADAGTLQQYILDECEHYGVYTAQVGSLSGTEQDLAEQAVDRILAKLDPATGNIPAEHYEAPKGKHLVDTIYTLNWSFLALQMAAELTRSEAVAAAKRKQAELLLSIQDRSDSDFFRGCWRGMYDLTTRSWGGGNCFEGGAGSIYTGWTNAPISLGLLLESRRSSLLDL